MIRGSLGLLLVCWSWFVWAQSPVLQPFVSDGCTLFPDGTLGQRKLWCRCCAAHDLAYWQGGSSEARKAADLALHQCVAAASGYDVLGSVMQAGVRVGGSPVFDTDFRWGYGWSDHRGYRRLSVDDQALVELSLAAHPAAAEFDRVCAVPPAASAAAGLATPPLAQ